MELFPKPGNSFFFGIPAGSALIQKPGQYKPPRRNEGKMWFKWNFNGARISHFKTRIPPLTSYDGTFLFIAKQDKGSLLVQL